MSSPGHLKNSFRPGGSVLKKKEESVASANAQALGGPGIYGNPFPSFPGPPGLAAVRHVRLHAYIERVGLYF